MKNNEPIPASAPDPERPPRLPWHRPGRLEEAPFWLLGLASLCAVVCFNTAIARFVPNAERFLARLQAAPLPTAGPTYAHSRQETNRPGELRSVRWPDGAKPLLPPAPAPAGATRNPSAI